MEKHCLDKDISCPSNVIFLKRKTTKMHSKFESVADYKINDVFVTFELKTISIMSN